MEEPDPNLLPAATWAHATRAYALEDSGEFDEAEEEFRRSLTLTPGARLPTYGLFSLLTRRGRLEEALALGKKFFSERTSETINGHVLDWKRQIASFEAHLASGELELLRQAALNHDWDAIQKPFELFADTDGICSLLYGSPENTLATLEREFAQSHLTESDCASYHEWYWGGVSTSVEEDGIGSFILYSEGVEGFSQFSGPLPGGLKFAFGREEVVERLGKPLRSREGSQWVEYSYPEYSYWIKFSEDDTSILVVSIQR